MRTRPKNTLQECLPYGYCKRVYDFLPGKYTPSPQLVYQVCTEARKNAEIREALHWVAVENLLSKLFLVEQVKQIIK